MPFADELIGIPTAKALREAIDDASRATTDLPALDDAAAQLSSLSLRERSDLLADALLADLPGDYPSFAATVRRASDRSKAFTGWMIWPVTTAVARKAVDDARDETIDDALALLAELTPRLTSEFALRLLLRHDLDRSLSAALAWTASDDEHVRRLASEGTRAYLPWATRVAGLIAAPESTAPILDALYRDDSDYVRRSVANHLNDLSRDNPELVVATAARWLAAPDGNTEPLVRHALRTLIKRGDPAALALRGFHPAQVQTSSLELDQAVVPNGGAVTFSAHVTNVGAEPANLAIDYVVHHQKANGKQTPKVFKLLTRVVAPGEQITVGRQHSFRAITTRRYHPGSHAIELVINGVVSGRAEFELEPAP